MTFLRLNSYCQELLGGRSIQDRQTGNLPQIGVNIKKTCETTNSQVIQCDLFISQLEVTIRLWKGHLDLTIPKGTTTWITW